MSVQADGGWMFADDPPPVGQPDSPTRDALWAWWSTLPESERPTSWGTDWIPEPPQDAGL